VRRLRRIGWHNVEEAQIMRIVNHLKSEAWLLELTNAPEFTKKGMQITSVQIPHAGSFAALMPRLEIWKHYFQTVNRDMEIIVHHHGPENSPRDLSRVTVLDDQQVRQIEDLLNYEAGTDIQKAFSFFCNFPSGPARYGVNRNRGLLLSRGKASLFLDDDAWPVWIEPVQGKPDSWADDISSDILTPIGFPVDLLWHSETTEEILSQEPRLRFIHSQDYPLASYEATLGAYPNPVDLSHTESFSIRTGTTSPAQKYALFRRFHPYAAVVSGGLAGVSGVGHRRFFIQTQCHWPPEFLENLLSVDEQLMPMIIRMSSARVFFSGNFSGLHYALDGYSPLPPFSPLGIDEDGLFSAMRALITPASDHVHLPLALGHRPLREKRYKPEDLSKIDLPINVLIKSLLANAAVFGTDWKLRCIQCGRYINEIANLPVDDFILHIATVLSKHYEGALSAFEDSITEIDHIGIHTKKGCTQYRDGIVGLITRLPDFTVQEFPDHSVLQNYLSAFGRSLEHWPAILELFSNIDWRSKVASITGLSDPAQ